MDELYEIVSKIEGSLEITCNDYKTVYADPSTYYKNVGLDGADSLDASKDIWTLRFYPKTSISFYEAASNDLESLIVWALEILKED